MKRKYLVWAAYAVVVIGLVAGSFAAGYLTTGAPVASAQPSAPGAPNSPDASFWCTIGNIAIYEDRIHVYCTNAQTVGADTVYYYAFPLDAAHFAQANRHLSAAYTALALGRSFGVWYDTNSAHNPPSCLTSNCRLLQGTMVSVP